MICMCTPTSVITLCNSKLSNVAWRSGRLCPLVEMDDTYHLGDICELHLQYFFCTNNFHLLMVWLWICVHRVLHSEVKSIFWQYCTHTYTWFWWELGGECVGTIAVVSQRYNETTLRFYKQVSPLCGNGLSAMLNAHLMLMRIKYGIPEKARVHADCDFLLRGFLPLTSH